jgi:hypothetical protein
MTGLRRRNLLPVAFVAAVFTDRRIDKVFNLLNRTKTLGEERNNFVNLK